MKIIENYKKVAFENFANFSGRAPRSEYWYFLLANLIVGFLIGIVGTLIGLSESGINTVANIWVLAFIIPGVAVSVRRVHDSNHSGWFVLIPLYNLYLMIIKGTDGPNRFG